MTDDAAAASPAKPAHTLLGRRWKKETPKPKLFIQLSRAQQRVQGKTEPMLRQVEGDTIAAKLVAFRKTIRFHVKAGHDEAVLLVHDIHKGLQDANARDVRSRGRVLPDEGGGSSHPRCRVHPAVSQGAEVAVLALIKEECSVDEPDQAMRWTPIHYAVMGKQKHIVAILLKYAPTPYVTINRRDKIGTTPLMLVRPDRPSKMTRMRQAAGEGHAKIVKLLLDNGADINDRDNDGMTALHYAALTDQVRAAETLVAYHCNLEIRSKSAGETALELAERINSHLVSIVLFEAR
ncbi:Aste57867_23291 [Aphanomyces stellatus]|uniref:Aste57867_23291 protein n=1 Tax=Aphanomyces stellatus TaxID=120398 RepID=A0A485LN56_9STRA|nr:hypothetical protein As57867_023220 [Aphanomyces stellatus]VFT99936.1 Aste57867_23291 [Aphanomyces stellatus]